ncbi:MAG: zinc ribbon domain-containing protein [Candidatus Tectomicrobia bacterium]|uniref:Zinc ribbon domain-containing protein n=1 Tax=Tectimicrobiota bacterium TaxID=2528274 RepID=A0A937W0C2_UNCTE|nr:zinc ribbon domain-containing protein [Candidatus Tectomicrobia bacterium]
MPIYEYRCLDCGHQFELMQKFSDPPAETCTACTGTVQKLISRSAFHLKGSGWYVTDYGRNGGSKGQTPANNGSESSPESSDSTSASEKSSDTSTASTSTSTETAKSSTASSAA